MFANHYYTNKMICNMIWIAFKKTLNIKKIVIKKSLSSLARFFSNRQMETQFFDLSNKLIIYRLNCWFQTTFGDIIKKKKKTNRLYTIYHNKKKYCQFNTIQKFCEYFFIPYTYV